MYILVIAIAKCQRARQKHEDDRTELSKYWELSLSFYYLKKEIKLKFLSVCFYLWKPFEHKEFSCNFLFCLWKCFSFTALLSDKMSLIKWIIRCLFTMLRWRHKVNAIRLVHSKAKVLFGITSSVHYLLLSGSLEIFSVCLNLARLCDAAASPASCPRSAASLAIIFFLSWSEVWLTRSGISAQIEIPTVNDPHFRLAVLFILKYRLRNADR